MPSWRHVVVASALCASCLAPRTPPQADLHPIPRQNVLLITIDTLRADALGSYGGKAATPALDRLAAEGVRFDFAHAHAVVTLPSHASILTGRYPFAHGLRDNAGYRLPAGTRTMATQLKEAGYATAAFTAAFPLHSRFGLNAGFDVYDDRFGETDAPAEFAMPERPASVVVPLARQWIAEHPAPGPWFVWVHLYDPHAPYRPPPPFDARYANRPYDGEVAAVDTALAPLLDDIRAAQSPTLVVVTSDHGEALGDHGEEAHGLFAYEATLRVPLIVAGIAVNSPQSSVNSPQSSVTSHQSSVVSRGEVSSVSARHIDLLPTVLDAVGRAVPPDLPGRSLLSAAERRAGGQPRPSYFEAMSGTLNRGWAPLAGAIVDREKFIDLPVAERYDLASDPAEQTNLIGRDAARDRTAAGVLRGFGAAPPGARQVEDGEAAARLRALGYVSGTSAPKARYTEDDDPKRLVELDRSMHRAVEAVTAGRGAEAEALYRSIIERRPDMSLAYQHLAFIVARRAGPAAAADVLRSGVRAGVHDPRAAVQLGGYLTDAGRVSEAITLLEPLAAGRSDVEALNALGIAYAQAGRLDRARQTFEAVAAINPLSSVPVENLGLLALQQGDAAAARRRYEAAVALNPRSSRAHSGLGAAASRGGDTATAIEEWTRAVQLDPANFDALYNLATTLTRTGQPDRAKPYLEQFLRTAPAPFEKDKREISRQLSAISAHR